MPILADRVLDLGLNVLDTEVDKFYLCSSEPTTYTQATSTFALGNYNFGSAGAAYGSPAAGSPNGRKVTSNAVPAGGGSVTASGTAAFMGAVDSANSRLDASYSLSASQAVTSGNTWQAAAFDTRIPNQ
jgi:hypothetical protein